MGRNVEQTVFAVPMTCESCVKDVSGALHQLKGIRKVEANLQDQLLSVEGTGMEFLPFIYSISTQPVVSRYATVSPSTHARSVIWSLC